MMKIRNLSKLKLHKIKDNITQIKFFLQKTPNNSEMLKEIEEINDYLQNFHFGLNYETYMEEIEEVLKKNDINLTEIENRSINGNNLKHSIIEGENLAVLTYLKPLYLSKIDVICIDPPYNTGNKELGYNDFDYMDGKDNYIHSKWLSFMEKRLRIAKELLSPEGTMFINIDETQIGCLILLCQEIFGEENVDVLIWPKTDPKYDANRVEKSIYNIKIVHEYIILCYKNKKIIQFNKILRRPNHSDFSTKEQYFDMESIINETGTTSSAKDEMNKIFGRRDYFSTPKPVKLIKELVRVASNQHSIILDFFAGSGTTGHAVIDLNYEDGGERIFILVNNNENNICKKITYLRLKWVFNHYNCPDTLKYYKLYYNHK